LRSAFESCLAGHVYKIKINSVTAFKAVLRGRTTYVCEFIHRPSPQRQVTLASPACRPAASHDYSCAREKERKRKGIQRTKESPDHARAALAYVTRVARPLNLRRTSSTPHSPCTRAIPQFVRRGILPPYSRARPTLPPQTDS
jgi:hypothetical protein